jgi:hypothetical protein
MYTYKNQIDLQSFFETDLYHALSWPQLSYVAEDHKGRIVGYVLAKMYVCMEMNHVKLSLLTTNSSATLGKKSQLMSLTDTLHHLLCCEHIDDLV